MHLIKLSTLANTKKVELVDLNNYHDELIICLPYESRELLKEITAPLIYLGYKTEEEKN